MHFSSSNLRFFYLMGLFVLTSCSLILTKPEEPTLEHRVRYKGETTYLVSSWYTGTPKNSKRLRNFNGLTTTKLQVGDEILIPRRLLIRTSVMPKSFIDSYYSAKQTTVRPSQAVVQKTILQKNDSPTDLAATSESSILENHPLKSTNSLGEPKPNEWVDQELERDTIQESIIKKTR